MAEFLAGLVVSGWGISLLGMGREAAQRPRLPRVNSRH